MIDPIGSAILRLARAHKHIVNFEAGVRMFSANRPHFLVAENNLAREHLFRVAIKQPLPVGLSFLAGDAIHNLNSVLDGLFRALTHEHGLKGDAYFPLRKTPEGFIETRGKYKRIPSEALDMLEDFQPYKRGQPLRTIHDLASIDKHRSILLAASSPYQVEVRCNVPFHGMICLGPVEDGSPIVKVRLAPQGKAKLNVTAELDVSFAEKGDSYGQHVDEFLIEAHDLIHDEVVPVFQRLLNA